MITIGERSGTSIKRPVTVDIAAIEAQTRLTAFLHDYWLYLKAVHGIKVGGGKLTLADRPDPDPEDLAWIKSVFDIVVRADHVGQRDEAVEQWKALTGSEAFPSLRMIRDLLENYESYWHRQLIQFLRSEPGRRLAATPNPDRNKKTHAYITCVLEGRRLETFSRGFEPRDGDDFRRMFNRSFTHLYYECFPEIKIEEGTDHPHRRIIWEVLDALPSWLTSQEHPEWKPLSHPFLFSAAS